MWVKSCQLKIKDQQDNHCLTRIHSKRFTESIHVNHSPIFTSSVSAFRMFSFHYLQEENQNLRKRYFRSKHASWRFSSSLNKGNYETALLFALNDVWCVVLKFNKRLEIEESAEQVIACESRIRHQPCLRGRDPCNWWVFGAV